MGASLTRPAALLRVEGAAILALSVLFYALYGPGWVLFLVLVLSPDLSMLGYLGGSRLGAAFYNLAHSYVLPALLVAFGSLGGEPLSGALALIWLAHIGFDRMMGFGLKYPDGFRETHLGRIGVVYPRGTSGSKEARRRT